MKLHSVRYKIAPELGDYVRAESLDLEPVTSADIEVFANGRANGEMTRGSVTLRFSQAESRDLREMAAHIIKIADGIDKDHERLK